MASTVRTDESDKQAAAAPIPESLRRPWSAADKMRLTAKQQTLRFPTHVAAKVQALCDLFPVSTRTQVVGDLVAAALDEVIEQLDDSLQQQFKILANKHYRKYENEVGIEAPPDLYPTV